MPAPRHRSSSRKPLWMIVLVSLVCVSLIGASVYPQWHYPSCYFFASNVCGSFKDWLPPVPARQFTDEEITARVVFRDILSLPPTQSTNPKIAFLFLTPGTLPFERLWDNFFLGHEGRFSIYVHASREKPVHISPLFMNRDIRSEKVAWGKISMVDAERRLLANALQDTDNQHFVLLSESCVPLHTFDFVYSYLMETNISFIDCFEDPGLHGTGRYSEHMSPEIDKKDWRKGAQWFSMKRQHALIVLSDSLYYTKFKLYCKIHTKKRNMLEHKRLNDLVYVQYNRRLRERFQERKKHPERYDPICLEDLNWGSSWMTKDGEDLVHEGDDLTWAIVDEAMGASEERARRGKMLLRGSTSQGTMNDDEDDDDLMSEEEETDDDDAQWESNDEDGDKDDEVDNDGDDEKGKFDEVVEDKGVKILIDPKALMHVIGTNMDFVDDAVRSEFIFINPNSKGQCGCGESFMTSSMKATGK